MSTCCGSTAGTAPRNGFTLVELLVALGLLALLTAVAVPMLSGRPGGAELHARAQAIADGLNRTRGAAIATNRPAAFELDLGARSFRAAGDTRAGRIPPGFAVSAVSARSETGADGRTRFRFFPDGSASGGRIVLSGATGRREIAIDWLTGGVRIADPVE